MTRVVIVGGTGKIGRQLARSLLAHGNEVVVLTRDVDRARRHGAIGELAAWSVEDPVGLAAALDGADAVVHLAGVAVGPWPWWFPGRRRAIVDSRIQSTRAVVDAIERLRSDRRPRILVSASGTDGYEGQDAVPVTEATPFSGGFLARLCRAWEGEARRAEAFGLRVAIIRTGFVLARGGPALELYALPFRLHLGGPLGSGRQWMSWVHIDDVVGIYRLALADERMVGPINAVAPDAVTEGALAAAIGQTLGRRSWLPVPAPLIRLAMGEAAVLPLGSRRILPARALALGYRHRWTDVGAALQDTLGPS
jgi:uncharacterized protein